MGHLKHVINTNRGGIGTFERIQNLCSRIGGGEGRCSSALHSGNFTPQERDQVPILQEAVWVAAPVWTGAENITSNWV